MCSLDAGHVSWFSLTTLDSLECRLTKKKLQFVYHTDPWVLLNCVPTIQANFIQYQGFTVVYRRYASLFFMVGIDNNQVPPCT
jgi:hypothetical protein